MTITTMIITATTLLLRQTKKPTPHRKFPFNLKIARNKPGSEIRAGVFDLRVFHA
jgi:hypothetical protein